MEDDMIAEVLLRLPLKSLTICKCLSKNWNNIISYNSSFRQAYASQLSRRSPSPLMLGFFFNRDLPSGKPVKTDQKFRFLPTSAEGNKLKLGHNSWGPPPLACPFDESLRFVGCRHVFVLASSNGLLLCSIQRYYPSSYYICNPITMEWVALPKPSIRSKFAPTAFLCEAGNSSKYKVVRGMRPKTTNPSNNLIIEIFSSESFEWRVLNVTCPAYFYLTMSHPYPSVVTNEQGVVYWLAKSADNLLRSVVVFDQTKEALQLVPIPDKFGYQSESIGFSRNPEGVGVVQYARENTHELQIWMLDETDACEKVWLLKYRVDLHITRGQLFTPPAPKMEGSRSLNYDTALRASPFDWVVEAGYQYLSICGFHPLNPLVLFISIGKHMAAYHVEDLTTTLLCQMPRPVPVAEYYYFPYVWTNWPPFFP